MNEADLQAHVVKLLQAYGRADMWWCHIPNGELRNHRVGARLKLAGVRRGAPDLLFVVDGRAIGLEMKIETGRLSAEQINTMQDFERANGVYRVAFGLDDAMQALTELRLLRENVKLMPAPGVGCRGSVVKARSPNRIPRGTRVPA